ncbi:MAG TPA: hypothetical protein DD490_22000 [Acidobacteria bacterium]|nr:hypothetical protein [Acidobacteriota bacterium]
MQIQLTRAAIVVAAGLTLAGIWQRMPAMSASLLLLYLVALFPYGLYAVMSRGRGPHLAAALGGALLLGGLWLAVLLGGPSLFAAVVTHLVASTVIGITVMWLGKRSRLAALRPQPQTPP